MATKEEWLTARIAYLRGLKSPTEMQKLLMILADKPDRTLEEEKKLAAVVRAEKAAGLDGQDRGALLGALLGMANVKESERWANWKRQGDALLAEKERNPKAATAIQPPATPRGQGYNDLEDSI
jgi:hypothetical protein